MKKVFVLFIALLFFSVGIAIAKDVSVKGYYRKNGTYVQPHVRSSPDTYKHNNYGPSKNDSQLQRPKERDYDRDGTPNYLDRDDDNDGITDDNDKNQYGRKKQNKTYSW